METPRQARADGWVHHRDSAHVRMRRRGRGGVLLHRCWHHHGAGREPALPCGVLPRQLIPSSRKRTPRAPTSSRRNFFILRSFSEEG